MRIFIDLEISTPAVWKPKVQIDYDPRYKDKDHDSYGLFHLWFMWLWFEFEFTVGRSIWDW